MRTPPTLTERIESLLKVGGYSVAGLADRLGVSVATIYRWRARPVQRIQVAVMRALDAAEVGAGLDEASVRRDNAAHHAAHVAARGRRKVRGSKSA